MKTNIFVEVSSHDQLCEVYRSFKKLGVDTGRFCPDREVMTPVFVRIHLNDRGKLIDYGWQDSPDHLSADDYYRQLYPDCFLPISFEAYMESIK